MSERDRPQIPNIIDSSTFPYSLGPKTEEALLKGEATMAEQYLQRQRDEWELNRLEDPTHGEPKQPDLDLSVLRGLEKTLYSKTDEHSNWTQRLRGAHARTIGLMPDEAQTSTAPVEEQPSKPIRDTINKTAEAYFRPKSFESKSLYEKMGIRFYKKYLPTSGDLSMKYLWRGNSLIPTTGTTKENIEMFEQETRTLEAIHLGILAVSQTVFIGVGTFDSIRGAAIGAVFQIGTNIYPIMLQRYNRIRAMRIINR